MCRLHNTSSVTGRCLCSNCGCPPGAGGVDGGGVGELKQQQQQQQLESRQIMHRVAQCYHEKRQTRGGRHHREQREWGDAAHTRTVVT